MTPEIVELGEIVRDLFQRELVRRTKYCVIRRIIKGTKLRKGVVGRLPETANIYLS
jgi:hypothetical protein